MMFVGEKREKFLSVSYGFEYTDPATCTKRVSSLLLGILGTCKIG